MFERFATVDAASNGRAEVTLGRGSFTESFPLFGFDLAQYEALFEEKLDLFAALLKQEPVTWQGNMRPPLTNQRVFPPLEKPAAQDLDRRRRQPGIRRPRRALRPAVDAGHHRRRSAAFHAFHRSLPARLSRSSAARCNPSACIRHGYVADTDDAGARGALAAPQGHARPHRRRARLAAGDTGSISTTKPIGGSLYVGAPETVARRIAATAKALGIARFDMKYSAGTLPHDKLMRSIELYGTKVMPLVREMLA